MIVLRLRGMEAGGARIILVVHSTPNLWWRIQAVSWRRASAALVLSVFFIAAAGGRWGIGPGLGACHASLSNNLCVTWLIADACMHVWHVACR